MSELLQGLKADLTSRRMLPLVVLALGLLAGALAYAVLSSKASAGPVAATPPVQTPTVPGPSVAQAPANPNSAVAETTTGSKYQHAGHVHNPFKPLPSEEKSAEHATGSSGSSGAGGSGSGESSTGAAGAGESSGGGSGASSGASGSGGSGEASGGAGAGGEASGGEASGGEGAGGATGAGEGEGVEQATVQAAKLSLKRVSSSGGTAEQQSSPAGASAKGASAPSVFGQLSSLTVLPSDSEKLLAYAGAQPQGQGVLVLLVKPAIVSGKARCLPSGAACEAIYLRPGKAERLQYLESSGETVTYTLTLQKLAKHAEPAAEAAAVEAGLVKRERSKLERLGISLPRDVHFSAEVEGTLEGLGEALQAARHAAQREKQKSAAGG